jgi:hypothetical protein
MQGINYIMSDDFQSYTIGQSVTNNTIRDIIIPTFFKGIPVIGISEHAFINNTNLENIEISEKIENISINFFNNCINLKNIVINENNQNYASTDGVLYNKQMDTLIYYPMGKTESSFTVPDTVIHIKSNAFIDGVLKNLIIPSSVEIIERGALNKELNIETLSLPFVGESKNTNQFLGYIFGAETYEDNNSFVSLSLKTVLINSGSLEIGAFYNCKNISDIILPNNLEKISDFAFSWTNIESFTIPESVNYIGRDAFSYCENLEKINSNINGEFIFGSNINFLGSGMISGCGKLNKLTIPFLGTDSIVNAKEGNIGYLGNLFDTFNAPDNYFLNNSKYIDVYQTIEYYPSTGGRDVSGYNVPITFKELTVTNASKITAFAISGFINLESIYLNCNINKVGKMAFDYWNSSQTIYYKYSMENWDLQWKDFCDANIVTN